jgi:predicted transcriptional regulator
VQAGLDAANAGDVIAAEEVETEAAAWRAQMRRKMADANS